MPTSVPTNPNYVGSTCCTSTCACASGGYVGPSTVFVAATTLTFAQPGRSYRVVVSWLSTQGSFSPFVESAMTLPTIASDWARNDSLGGPNQMGWTVYVPSNAGTPYMPLSLTVSAFLRGYWSRLDNFSPVCAWATPVLIP